MFLLHDAHEEERKKQDLLLLWLLLGEFGLPILHGGDGGWQQRALLRWLLLGEYGLTYFFTHITPSLLLLHNVGMILGYSKANRAKNESIKMLNQIHETWDEGMYCMMKLFLCEKGHFILCISCINDDVGHHMVVTWYFMVKGGHLTIQLGIISYISER